VGNSKKVFTLLIPSLTVFMSSACIMIIELVASRLIARYLGSSLYTWTSVIGVVLAGITIGNYLGGRLADKFQPRKTLSALFCLASIACVVIVILNNVVGDWLWLWRLSWPVRVFLHVSMVFLLPSVLLGTISPVVAKMALDKGLATGKTIGTIYAWGAAGSIAGTFLAGFYLIAAMGTIAIIWTIALILLLMAIAYRVKSWPVYIWAVILIVFFFLSSTEASAAQELGTTLLLREKPDSSVIYEDETAYCYVAVKKIDDNPNHLAFHQDKLKHSEILLDNPDDLQYFYTKIYAAVTEGLTKDKKTPRFMIIGGGGYVYPRYLQKLWPESSVDVVEIDPGVTEAAMAAFGLSRDTKINSISLDARNYVDELLYKRSLGQKIPLYDFIYEDAINDYSVPFQLVTKEFTDKISEILTHDGVYMVNLIDVFDSGLFLGSVVNTLKKTFPYVSAVTEEGTPYLMRNTFVVVASKKVFSIDKIISGFTKGKIRLWQLNEEELGTLETRTKGLVLSDDFAPVENLLAPVVRESAKDFLATKYMNLALENKKIGKFDKSIAFYQDAVKTQDRLSLKAYNEIGMIYAIQQEREKAAQAFQKAIDYNESQKDKGNIGSIYFNLGLVLRQSGKEEQANQQLRKSIEALQKETAENPTATAYAHLGNAYATIGDFASASEAFSQAVKLNPSAPESYDNLARTLEYQGRYEEAIAVCQQLIGMMASSGQDTQQIQRYIASLQQQKEKAGPSKD